MEKKSCPECDGMYVPLTGGGLRAHGPVYARCAQDPANRVGTRVCEGCDKAFVLTDSDTIPPHGPTPGVTCPQVSDPAPTVKTVDDTQKGPWFGAMYSGECAGCFDRIEEGDRIRADGQGGYECEDCGEEEPSLPVAALYSEPTEEAVTDAMPFKDPWDDPAPAVEQKPDVNVSGQPKARYEWRGSVNMGYLVKDPGTGDFRRYAKGTARGVTRVTTFVKAASDSKAINDWGKRNIVIGASRRPNVLLRANGLTHENDCAALTQIVAELEEAAGAKVGSDLGTFLHEFTEQMDAGLKTWRDAPEQFRRSLARYEQSLEDAGLEPVPGLIERTTMVREFGGVVGTFDRVFCHRPSGTYLIGDLKTGKTMEYSMDETNTQMWLYAHGVNQSGVYDWNTDTWAPPGFYGDSEETGPWQVHAVREDVGVIIHMPVQGPQAGTVTLVHADLEAGARHAELCHAVRSRHRSKVAPFMVPDLSWAERFKAVRRGEEAAELWRQAKAAGVAGMELNELIMLARHALASRVDSPA